MAVFLTLTGAFELSVLPLLPRFLYWLVVLGIGQGVSLLLRASLDRVQMPRARLLLAGFLRCVLVSLPVTVLVWLLTGLALAGPLRFADMPQYYLPVLVVTAAMLCLNALAQRRPVETHAVRKTKEEVQPAPILARLPPALRGAKLHAVQAEDHYIRLHTSAGSDLVLLRFSDALAELRGIEGVQVHRSWWVARDAVTESRKEGGRLFLVLHGGTKAPVSRSFARALQEGGWI